MLRGKEEENCVRKRDFILVSALGVALLLGGCMTSLAPAVILSIEPASGYAPLRVRLDADAVLMEEPISYQWVFGDGSTADEPVVGHEFVGKGPITVRLVVTDALGQQAVAEGIVLLLNRIPHAQFSYQPYRAPTHQPVFFDGTGSFDPGGEVVSYRWDFDDGTEAEGAAVEHAFEVPDRTYQVTLTVTDDGGDTNAMYRLIEPIGCDH